MNNTKITKVTLKQIFGRSAEDCLSEAIHYCMENKVDVCLVTDKHTYEIEYSLINLFRKKLKSYERKIKHDSI